MKIPKHVTDITRSDFEEIARAANPSPGLGMEINPKKDTIEFAISAAQFKRMLWAFYHNGGFSAAASELDGISLDVSPQT